MTRQQREARHVITAMAVTRDLTAHDQALRDADRSQAAEFARELLAAHTRALRAKRAFCDRYGVATTGEIASAACLSNR